MRRSRLLDLPPAGPWTPSCSFLDQASRPPELPPAVEQSPALQPLGPWCPMKSSLPEEPLCPPEPPQIAHSDSLQSRNPSRSTNFPQFLLPSPRPSGELVRRRPSSRLVEDCRVAAEPPTPLERLLQMPPWGPTTRAPKEPSCPSAPPSGQLSLSMQSSTQQSQNGRSDDLASCPICCGDLHSKKDEIGALTHNGMRIESSLYHASCVTMMLCHNKSILDSNNISWGLSPVTRKAVDGFKMMPPLGDHDGWLKFTDWKRDGYIDVEELGVAITAILPLSEDNAKDLIRNTFELTEDGPIPEDQIRGRVLPYLQQRSVDPCKSTIEALRNTRTPYQDSERIIRLLGPIGKTLSRWRGVCRSWFYVAHAVLSFELCQFLMQCLTDSPITRDSRANIFDAATALGHLMVNGDRRVAHIAVALFDVHDEKVLRKAVSLLAKFKKGTEPHISELLFKKLSHPNALVRVAATDALAVLLPQGNRHTIQRMFQLLEDTDESVRRAVIKNLGALAKGDRQTIDDTLSRLKDNRSSVREDSIKVLLSIAEKDDSGVIEVLSDMALRDSDFHVRRCASSTLSRIAQPGNTIATKAIVSQVKTDPELKVVYWSLKSLTNLAVRGNRDAIDAAISRLGGDNSSVRCQAVDAVRTLSLKGDEHAFRSILAYINDKDPHVQAQACQALSDIADTKEQRLKASQAVRRDCLACAGCNPTLKRAAELALEILAISEEDCSANPKTQIGTVRRISSRMLRMFENLRSP